MKKTYLCTIIIFTMTIAVFCIMTGCKGGGDDTENPFGANVAPVWSPAPADITVSAGGSYYRINGRAIDANRPSQLMTCTASDSTCSFNVQVAGIGSGAVSCMIMFTPPQAQETCSVNITAADDHGAAVTQAVSITIEQNLNISNCLPNPVQEGNAVSCTVSASGGTPQIDGANDTCGGAINGSGPWTYDFTSTEAQGPAGCIAAIQMVQNNAIKASQAVAVDESNVAPTVSIDCPPSISEQIGLVCYLTTSDGDLPNSSVGDPGYVTCALNAATTCTGVTISGCTLIDMPAQGEAAGPGSCSVVVDITDGYGATGQGSDTITINEANNSPGLNMPGLVLIPQFGSSYSADVATGSDSDLPNSSAGDPGYITCSATTTCAYPVTVTGSGNGSATCHLSFTVYRPGPCNVEVKVTDGYGTSSVSGNISISVAGTLYFVSGTGDNVGCGSWADGCLTVQGAMDLASSGDVIFVKTGTFTATDANPLVTMKSGVRIYGGFAGTEDSLDERGDPSANPSILNGNMSASHVVVGSSNSVLDGFTITYGYATAGANGAGMYNLNATNLTISNDIFFRNLASGLGGGMHNQNSSPTIDNCYFNYNGGMYGGSGLSNYGGLITVSNSIFYNNRANFPSSLWGGAGILNNNTTLVLTDSYFSRNMTYGYGGAISNLNSSQADISYTDFAWNFASKGGGIANLGSLQTISNSYFYHNAAAFYSSVGPGNYSNGGGGILNYSSIAYIYTSGFNNNIAYDHGGGINDISSTVTMANCSFNNNDVYGGAGPPMTPIYKGGGAINNYNSTIGIDESTFYYNNVGKGTLLNLGYGGAILNNNTQMTISNSILESNVSTISSGAIHNTNSSNSFLLNCLLANNRADPADAVPNGIAGGIRTYNSGLNILNCTLAYNQSSLGDQVYTVGSNIIIQDSILWGTANGISNPTYATYPVNSIRSDVKWLSGPTYPGTANINNDPLFVSGFFLSQIPEQASTSPCVDAGSGPVPGLLSTKTTSTAGTPDTGTVDIGFHYDIVP